MTTGRSVSSERSSRTNRADLTPPRLGTRRTGFPQGALGAMEQEARKVRWCRVAPSAPEGNPVQAPLSPP